MKTISHILKTFGLLAGLLALSVVGYLLIGWPRPTQNQEFGATFSRVYARDELKLNADAVLLAALDELQIRRFRIPAYWKTLQPSPDVWKFDDLDRDVATIAKRNGKIVLALGEKVPRWPECWAPDWWKKLPRDEQRATTLAYVEKIVMRYKDNPAIIAWQVENEPHFPYGDCPKPDWDFLQKEIGLVRRLDPSRPITTTDSGELSTWRVGRFVDRLGVSVYRVVKNRTLGTWRYWFFPSYFYKHKANLAKLYGVKNIYISEFQMEPWSDRPLPETPFDEQFRTLDIEQMRTNFHYARHLQLSPVDFWGIEWWYWIRQNGHPEFWEEAKKFFAEK